MSFTTFTLSNEYETTDVDVCPAYSCLIMHYVCRRQSLTTEGIRTREPQMQVQGVYYQHNLLFVEMIDTAICTRSAQLGSVFEVNIGEFTRDDPSLTIRDGIGRIYSPGF